MQDSITNVASSPRPSFFRSVMAAFRSNREAFSRLNVGLRLAAPGMKESLQKVPAQSWVTDLFKAADDEPQDLTRRLLALLERDKWKLTDQAGWPHCPCVKIFKSDGSCSVTYFGTTVRLVRHQFAALLFYAEWAKQHQGPAPDEKLQSAGVTLGDLAAIMSRIRNQFRRSAQAITEERLRPPARALVKELFPPKKPHIGYFLGRPELIEII